MAKAFQKAMIMFTLLITLNSLAVFAQQGEPDVILQGFYWNTNPGDITTSEGIWWDTLATVSGGIAGAGFQTVWTPPPGKGLAGVHDMGYGLYDYYDFGEFNQKGTVRTRHGNRAQLEAMITALHNAGLRVMADVVLNHRGGAEAQQPEDCDDGDGQQLRFTEFRPLSQRLPADAWHFHPNAFPGHCNLFDPFHNRIFFEDICYFNFLNNILDPQAAQDGWFFGPHNLGDMGDSLVVWGRFLIEEMGFDEVRLDAVKHIEPGFLAPFIVELKDGPQPFAVGEFFDGNMGAVKFYHDEVERFVSTFGTGSKDASLAMFDFNLRYALRDMANDLGGNFNMWDLNFRGLRLNPDGALNGEDIVTFVENHDTDRGGYKVVSSGPCDQQVGNTCLEFFFDSGHDPVIFDKHMAYAYIMAAEGRPSVFWKDWFWFNLDREIKWQMALRRQIGVGNTTPVKDLNPFSFDGLIGDDLFALRRDGSGSGKDGAMLMLNDDPSATFSFYLDSPNGWANGEVKDYSDAFMFETSQVFADGRALYKCPPRNYSWYAPTGLYPRPPEEPASAFNLGDHVGAKLHYVVLRAADMAQFQVNGETLQPGDQVAILHTNGADAVGLGRIGQSFEWDGVHDMIIEVLGGSNADEAKGGLLNGDPLRLAIYDQSTANIVQSDAVTFASSGTNFTFSANRPASRGGSTPFNLTATQVGNYQVGGISLIIGFTADNQPPEITVADPIILWPPNHQYVTIDLAECVVAVSDNVADLEVSDVYITAVSSDEAEDAPEGDGNTFDDIVIGIDCQSVDLRQERHDGGNGRVYTIHVAVDDGNGNVGTAACQVQVPHDQGSMAIDDGPVYTVKGACGGSLFMKSVNGGKSEENPVLLANPDNFSLEQNYPNPFNPATRIRFALPEAANVTLRIYDSTGQLVRTLASGSMDAGYHSVQWDGTNEYGTKVASGIYIYRLSASGIRQAGITAGAFVQTRKMILMK